MRLQIIQIILSLVLVLARVDLSTLDWALLLHIRWLVGIRRPNLILVYFRYWWIGCFGMHLFCYKTVLYYLVYVFFFVALLLFYVVLLYHFYWICRRIAVSHKVLICCVSPLLVACFQHSAVVHHIVEHVGLKVLVDLRRIGNLVWNLLGLSVEDGVKDISFVEFAGRCHFRYIIQISIIGCLVVCFEFETLVLFGFLLVCFFVWALILIFLCFFCWTCDFGYFELGN